MQLGIHTSYYSKTMFNKHLNKILFTLATIYIFSMGIWPLLASKGSWDYTLGVWHHWQGFNVGVLALLTSLMAFKITRYREDVQRKRDFIAESSLLPHVLSDLCEYLDDSAELLIEAYQKVREYGRANCNEPLEHQVPELDEVYKEVFRDCIRFAEPDVAKYLADIIVRLQVHHSRMVHLSDEFRPDRRMVNRAENIESYISCLIDIRALVNHIFEFARGEERFYFESISDEMKRNARSNLGISDEF
ncbi:hypothetical protein [Kangiella sediminilitoris]|uniref:Uncharacterized protein n=1 Tax=Kangiella sediminilitoris TaxID=1144748 RepID=A0A1B3BA72_9GAMM|nr:hypothetical protein [Kangiella sediminilitoris]AOE49709.1 hypothetical protein KS2013_988 [Kangiella sediminilitoris]